MTAKQGEYKPTMFDRYGPAAGDRLRVYSYGLSVFGLVLATLLFTLGQGAFRTSFAVIVELVLVAAAAGALVAFTTTLLPSAAGAAYTHLMVSGSTTPYKEQYSYQQALVMQGRVDEALESYEAVIAEKPDAVDARVKAAELYLRTKGDATRAAELFREVRRIPSVSAGEDIYATNRLIDLLNGPLNDRGRALVELRRLVEKYPGSAAADHARDALSALKLLHIAAPGID